jgi:hypothetical protein
MPKKITLPPVAEAEVILNDPDHDAGDRVYRLVPFTRAVKADLNDIQDDVTAIMKPLAEGEIEKLSRDDDDRVTRLMCDQLNLALKGSEDGPKAGDLLYDGYMAGRVVDDQILALYSNVFGTSPDPT